MTAAAPPPDDASARAEFRAIALELASTLIEQTTSGRSAGVPARIQSWAQLDDVTYDAERFGSQFEYVQQAGLPLPCITSLDAEEPLPVDANDILFPRGTRADLAVAARQLRQLEGPGPNGYIELLPRNTVREAFTRRLSEFLGHRLLWAEGENATRMRQPEHPPGLLFEVTTDTPGLRVHYHPAYWHETKTVFGNLSTPAYDHILPGRYMFGAVGPEQDLVFDRSEYDIPPNRTAHLFR